MLWHVLFKKPFKHCELFALNPTKVGAPAAPRAKLAIRPARWKEFTTFKATSFGIFHKYSIFLIVTNKSIAQYNLNGK